MIAKTAAQRQAEYVARRKADGLKLLRNFWCHPDDEHRIRSYADKLARRRAKGASD